MQETVMQARRLMKASRIDVTSAEQDLQDDEDGSMADPDGVLRTVELYRQQQQRQPASGQALFVLPDLIGPLTPPANIVVHEQRKNINKWRAYKMSLWHCDSLKNGFCIFAGVLFCQISPGTA